MLAVAEMNWKRGLKRIYVVLWILFALLGAAWAFSSSSEIRNNRKEVVDYLRDHQDAEADILLGNALRAQFPGSYNDLPDEEVGRRFRTKYLRDDPLAGGRSSFEPDPIVADPRTESVLRLAQDKDFNHPGRAHAYIWGTWLLSCGLAPWIALAITAWIVKGFERDH